MNNFLIFLVLLFAFPASAYACTCSLGTIEQKFENHPVVFLGTVSDVIRPGEKNGFKEERIQVAFKIEKRWKGTNDQSELDTWDNKVSCEGYWFKKGLRYLVFSSKGKNGLTVRYCGGVIEDKREDFKKHMEFLDRQPIIDSPPKRRAFNSYPFWAPDGKRIVFSSNRSGQSELYVIDADGKNLTQITKEEGSHPSWSPDGSMIAFDSNRDGKNREIYVMNADGSDQRRLTKDPAWDGSPFWSPDGRRLVFYSERDGNAEIYEIDLKSVDLKRLTNTPEQEYYASYSPDGKELVMESKGEGEREIAVGSTEGPKRANLTENTFRDHLPTWSPDGKAILFVSRRDGNDEIYVMNRDGSGATNLTNQEAVDVMPKWSPDGSKIVFVSNRDGGFEIYTMKSNGKDVRRVEVPEKPKD